MPHHPCIHWCTETLMQAPEAIGVVSDQGRTNRFRHRHGDAGAHSLVCHAEIRILFIGNTNELEYPTQEFYRPFRDVLEEADVEVVRAKALA